MRIPCVSIVIPTSTSPVVRAPAYMAPLFLEIWRAKLASEGKTNIEILPIAPREYKEIDSVAEEKAYLSEKFGRSEANGQIVFDKVYPGDAFERMVERILEDEAKRELESESPAERYVNPDFLALVKDPNLAADLHERGFRTLEDVATSTLSKLSEIDGVTPGNAQKLIALFAGAAADDAKAKAAAANAKPLEETKSKK